MIKFFPQPPDWIADIRDELKFLRLTLLNVDKNVAKLGRSDFDSDLLKLTRHNLGSLDLSDVKVEMTPEQRAAYNSQVSAVYESLILPTLKRLAHDQVLFLARNAQNWEQSVFARGTLNGIKLLEDEFEDAHEAHLAANRQPEPPSDPHNPLPEL